MLRRARRAWALRHDPVIRPFIGQVIGRRLLLGGRVLREGAPLEASSSSARWRNLFNTYRSFVHAKVPQALLRADFAGEQTTVTTDRGGYFRVEMELPAPVQGPLWQEVAFELLEAPHHDGPPVRAVGQVLAHPMNGRFAVISDIDDTILSSNVTSKIRMLLTVLLSNAHTRMPFAGVGALYRALERGHGDEHNPIFYVSNGPWNLHDLLVDFFRLNDIPLGPIHLRDWGVHLVLTPRPSGTHKRLQIERILAFFPQVPVVLIGDSGEHDPEIFAQLARAFPGRVDTIYIRDVGSARGRRRSVEKLAAGLHEVGTEFLLVGDSEAAAVHAAAKGLIPADAVTAVRSDRRKDQD